ncbi:MAG: hypothetical protein Q9179_004629 [Wetmoreana sp. 5 TL-2023]
MWNRILGKSTEDAKSPSKSESRQNSQNHRSTSHRAGSIKSTSSSRQTPRNEERDRGFNPISTSYSSTTRNEYPGTASASIGSSYATASSDPVNESYLPPGLVRNASLADQIPTSLAGDGGRVAALESSSKSNGGQEDPEKMDRKRDRKEQRGTRDRDEDKQERKKNRDRKSRRDSEGRKDRAMSTDEAAHISGQRSAGTARASNEPNGSSASVPLAGRYATSRPESSHDVAHPKSSHIQDQFPGQFPSQSAAPYRPRLAASEGGPGLAAEYYGDAGQSVADQPGIRIQSPSLIVGAEPHLQAASAVAAPPPEPSASGGVGAAASFFDGSFNAGSDLEDHQGPKPTSANGSSISQYNSAVPPSAIYPSSNTGATFYQSSSAPVIPTLDAAAAGAAAGYYMSNHSSKPEQSQHHSSSVSGYGKMSGSSSHHQQSEIHDSYTSYPSSSRPPTRPGKYSTQSSDIPLYTAGAVGAAAAAYHHNHHTPSQHTSHGQHHHNGGSMAQQHRYRRRGPLSKFVDFFKDPEGVAQFEEYTEYIGICRHCFAPGSSPGDAPRKHHYRRRRSNERFGSSVRVDKDTRYWTSENENQRRKDKSWFEAGIAGYGLTKIGETLFKQDRDLDDSHSVKSGRLRKSHRRGSSSSFERRSYISRGVINRSTDTLSHRSPSHGRVETGITSDGKLYRRDSHGHIDTSTLQTHTSRRRSRSSSGDRKGRGSKAGVTAALASTAVATAARQRSRSPKTAFVRYENIKNRNSSELASVLKLHESVSHDSHHRLQHSPDRKHRKSRRKEKKSKGFFTFGNGSFSSSCSSSLAPGVGQERKLRKSTKAKKKHHESREADAALLGLGAVAAGLALNQNQRSRRKGELIAVKEAKGKHKPSKHEQSGRRSSSTSDEDLWESASEGEWSSADSELAYGASLHRRSHDSLSSESSGLEKWGWRWGSKKPTKKAPSDRRRSSSINHVGLGATATAAATGAAQVPSDRQWQDNRMTSTSNIPMQHVYPMPTSDPTRYDVAGHDQPKTPFYQPSMNARPDPVPIQHPQPVAPVSSSVYTSQVPYSHSYSAPTGPPIVSQHPHVPSVTTGQSATSGQARNDVPGAFPTGSEYFEPFMRDSPRNTKPRRRDSSPATRASDLVFSPSAASRRRKSLKDDASSVRFDLTKEQEDKDRRDVRRRRKEEEKRRERLERRESEERKESERVAQSRREILGRGSTTGSTTRSNGDLREELPDNKKESWAAPAAAGAGAAIVSATVAAEKSRKEQPSHIQKDDRDIEVTVKERYAPIKSGPAEEIEDRGRPAKKESVWQAAAKIRRSSSHTDYAAYFTPCELLSKKAGAKETVGANADADVVVHRDPQVITVEPSERRSHSPSRAYSFPSLPDDVDYQKKPLPWSVPIINLIEPTPPTSKSGSIAGSRSPHSRSPLANEVPIDIPLKPLESVVDIDAKYTELGHVEYTVIEPKERSTESMDSPAAGVNITEAVPGISSLKNRHARKKSPLGADYGDDLDFAATVAAGLQDTGFNPSIVIDDPFFRRRDSPPGSEDDGFPRSHTSFVTDFEPVVPASRSPPHGFVEELPEHHMPGSFQEEEGPTAQPKPRKENIRSMEQRTRPSDNAGIKPNIYSIEPDAFEFEDIKNAAIDPVVERSWEEGKATQREYVNEELTGPSDNAGVRAHVHSTEPENFEREAIGNTTMDAVASALDHEPKPDGHQLASEDATGPSDNNGVKPHVYTAEPGSFEAAGIRNMAVDPTHEYISDEARSSAATVPVSSSSKQEEKSRKKSKRRSVGFDDAASLVSSPPRYDVTPETNTSPKKGRKGGVFGLFSKSTETVHETKGSQETPVEASLEDFEEPKKRSKKSKNRKATVDEDESLAASSEPVSSSQPEAQNDGSTSKKSKRGKEKRRGSEGTAAQETGRTTQDLPAQVMTPASPGRDPLPSSTDMLTNLENQEPDLSSHKPQPYVRSDDVDDLPRTHDLQQPSFLGERPEKPPLPDLPDASQDPGGQREPEYPIALEEEGQPSEGRADSPATKADKQKWRLSDLQSDGRSLSYPSPSPTAIPLRPLRFGRRPSSPGLAKSLPSTPQPSAVGDSPFTPRRRERPHSTEFKSNEFRPMWLLEKHGSRQEPTPQETYPSLPSSHSTSRTSSVHEADNIDQTQALDLARDESNYLQHRPENRGLRIETSRREIDSELLDSQQTTPTAASFHSMLKEGDAHAQKSSSEEERPKLEVIDVIPGPDAYVDPVAEPPQDGRLLHGIDDLFPRRPVSSPSRYEVTIDGDIAELSEARAPSPRPSSNQSHESFMSMLKDTALGALVGGSAAALLKSTSQHNEQLEGSLKEHDLEEAFGQEEDPTPAPAESSFGRPTAEELRLRQEQDAQDAVDSWFAPASPKKSKDGKRGKKRGKINDESEAASLMDHVTLNVQQKADTEQPRPVAENAVLAAEPTKAVTTSQPDISASTIASYVPRDQASAEPAPVDWQAALATRKDSKGKKNRKKNKDLSKGELVELTVGQLPDTRVALDAGIESSNHAGNDTSLAGSKAVNEPSTLSSEAEGSRHVDVPPTNAEFEESSVPSRKTKKDKEKYRASSLAQSPQGEIQQGSPTAEPPKEPIEEPMTKDVDIPFDQRDVPTAPDMEEIGLTSSPPTIAYKFPHREAAKSEQNIEPAGEIVTKDLGPSVDPQHAPIVEGKREGELNNSVSKAVPYKFAPPGEARPEAPTGTMYPTEEPLNQDNLSESNKGTVPRDLSMDISTPPLALDSPVIEDRPAHEPLATGHLATDEGPLPSQKPTEPDVEWLISPEAVPLPLNDDLDLLEALPESPVIQPVDVTQTEQLSYMVSDQQSDDVSMSQQQTSDHIDEPTQASDASLAAPGASVVPLNGFLTTSNTAPTVLERVASDLNLPKSVALDQAVPPTEAGGDDVFASGSGHTDGKKDKGKNSQASVFEAESQVEKPVSATSSYVIEKTQGDQGEVPDTAMQEVGPPHADLVPDSSPKGFVPETLEEDSAAPKGRPEDEWPTFKTTKDKKGKKGRKDKRTEAEPEQEAFDVSVPEAVSTSVEAAGGTSTGREVPPAVPAVSTPSLRQAEIDFDKSNTSEQEPIGLANKSIAEPVKENAEWPSTTKQKKQKKGRKDEMAEFDDFQESQPGMPEVPAAPEILLASTSTAEAVQDLLNRSEPGRTELSTEGGGANDLSSRLTTVTDVPEETRISPHNQPREVDSPPLEQSLEQAVEIDLTEEPVPEPATIPLALQGSPMESVAERQSDAVDPALAKAQNPPSGELPIADTGTAVEVQEMLTKAAEPISLPVVGDSVLGKSETATAADEFAWAPYQKKGRESRVRGADNATDTYVSTSEPPQPGSATLNDASALADTALSEQFEEFLVKTPKKDKESKHMSLQRSASGIQEVQVPLDAPLVEGSHQAEEMAITDKAPSVVKKTDGLPNIDMRTSPEAPPLGAFPTEVAPLQIDAKSIGPSTSQNVLKTGIAFDPEALENPVSTVEASEVAVKREMEIFTEAPSTLDKHDQLPSIQVPTSVEPVQPEGSPSSQGDRTLLVATQEGHDTVIPTSESRPDSLTIPKASPIPVEDAPTFAGLGDIGMIHSTSSVKEAYDELPDVEPLAAPDSSVMPRIPEDNTTSLLQQETADQLSAAKVVTEEPAFQSPVSKKDKKKARKARTIEWDKETPVSTPTEQPEQIPEIGNKSLQLSQGSIEEPVAEAPMKRQKDKKTSKKGKVVDWTEEPASSIPEGQGQAVRLGDQGLPDEDIAIEMVPSEVQGTAPEQGDKSLPVSKDKKKSRKAQGLASDEGVLASLPEPSAEVKEQQDESTAQIIEPTIEEHSTPATGNLPQSKRDKKKNKKVKASAWEDDVPEASTSLAGAEQDVAEPDPERVTDSIVGDRPNIADEQSHQPAKPHIDEELEDPDEQRMARKSRKKGKKSKFMAWEEPSVPTVTDEPDQQDPISVERVVTEKLQDVNEPKAEPNTEAAEERATSKKSKKKGKMSKFVAWDNEPSLPSSRDEREQVPSGVGPEAAESISNAPVQDDGVTLEDSEFLAPKSGKSKKAKKSKALSLEDEAPSTTTQGVPASVTDELPRDIIDGPIESAEAPKSDLLQDEGRPLSSYDVESGQDTVAARAEGRLAEPVTAAADEADATETASPRPAHEPPVYEGDLPAVVADVHSKPATDPPTADHVESSHHLVSTPAEDSIKADDRPTAQFVETTANSAAAADTASGFYPAESTASGPSDQQIEAASPPPVQTSNVIESAPSTGDALKVAEDTILPPSEQTFADPDSLPESVTKEQIEPLPAPTTTDAPKSAEEQILDPVGESLIPKQDLPINILKEPASSTPAPEAEAMDIVEEFPLLSKKDKKKAKKAKKAMTWEEEAPASIQDSNPALDKNTRDVEMPAPDSLVSPDILTEPLAEPVLMSKKDKKKAKKNRTFSLDEGPPESTMYLDQGPEAGIVDQTTIEPTAPPQVLPEVLEEFPSMSKKDKKKAKKNKTLTFEDETSESTTRMDLDLGRENLGQATKAEAEGEAVDEFELTSRKDKQKAKKDKRPSASDNWASESATPAETWPEAEVVQQTVEDPVVLAESVVAEGPKDLPSMTEKDKKSSKKAKKAVNFGEEPSETTDPVEPIYEANVVERANARTPLPVEVDVGEAVDDFPSISKTDKKKAKKNKKTLPSEDEPLETTASVEAIPEADIVEEPTEEVPVPAETLDDIPSMSKKDKKKAKKNKQVFSVDDEPSESTTPVKLAPKADIMEQATVEPREPTENVNEFPVMSKKERKKAKKNQKALAFNDDQPESVPMDEGAESLGDQLHKPVSILPLAPEFNQGETTDSTQPHNNSSEPPAEYAAIGSESENRLNDAFTNLTMPLERDPGAEPELFVGGKKSKKFRKKQREAQTIDWRNNEVATDTPLPGPGTSMEDKDVPLPEGEISGPLNSKITERPIDISEPAAEVDLAHDVAEPQPQVDHPIDTIREVPEEDTWAAPSKKGKKAKKQRKDMSTAQSVDEVTGQPDAAVTGPYTEESEQPQVVESALSPPVVEQELAPRHQDPASIAPTEVANPEIRTTNEGAYNKSDTLERPLSPPSDGPPVHTDFDTVPAAETLTSHISAARESQDTGEPSQSTVQEPSVSQCDDFTSFAVTKKPKTGKKAKEQPIIWEDYAATSSAPIDEPQVVAEDDTASSRPKIAAWPTEVRLDQSTGPVPAQEQPSSILDAAAADPATTDNQFLVDEPLEPPPVEEDRNDYFGHSPNHQEASQLPPPDDESHEPIRVATLDIQTNSTQPKIDASPIQNDLPATTETQLDAAAKLADQPAAEAEQPRSQDIATDPVGESQSFAPTKKDKSKRKKKQAVADVMWEFPPIDPPVAPAQAVHEASLNAPVAMDPLSAKLLRNSASEEPSVVPEASRLQADSVNDPAVPEEPFTTEVADDDWGSTPNKGKAVEQDDIVPQPSRDAADTEVSPRAVGDEPKRKEPEMGTLKEAYDFEDLEKQRRMDEGQVSSTGAGEAIATAAAVSAGLVAAEQLGRKESKKGMKDGKSRQASSTWTEPEDKIQPVPEAQRHDDGQRQPSRSATPERRSPIQAWHQYISPGQSPKQSELYEVKDGRPRSITPPRRKRSYDGAGSRLPSPERRSPIEAWQQYNSPRHSPAQSDFLKHEPRGSRSPPAVNRDSAVHVSDSPMVSERSPVRRAMRDSGYPESEASPIVGLKREHHEDAQGSSYGLAEAPSDHGHGFESRTGLNISPEGLSGYRDSEVTTKKTHERSQSPPRHEDEPHDGYQSRSFEEPRDPSPVSSTTKDRSSVLFHSSPSTREGHINQGENEAVRALDPPREDNSAMVNARAESLAALSGLRGPSQTLFGGPVDISSDSTSPATPVDHEGTNRRRLNTITEYSPEESPLHKKTREVSDVGAPEHGTKAARRSGTPQAISKRRSRARSPPTGHGESPVSTDELISRLPWPAVDEEKHSVGRERSGSQGTELRPSSRQSNISSLVSGQPKQREYERRSLSGASNRSIESINAIIRTPPDQMRSASGMSNRSSGTPPLRRVDRSVSGDLRGANANRKSDAKKGAKDAKGAKGASEAEREHQLTTTATPHDSNKGKSSKSRVKEMADIYVSREVLTSDR